MSAQPGRLAFRQAPSVVGGDLRRFLALTWTLAVTDFKLRFYGSVLGYFWTLARPFAFFGVLYFVFTEIVPLGEGVKNYAAYILMGFVLFGFFTQTVGTSLVSLVTRESLLRKMRFPRLVIPMAAVLGALFYASPILYVATLVPEQYQGVYLCNPLAVVLTQVRHAVIDPDATPVWDAIGGAERLAIPVALVLGVFALGVWAFRREAPRVAENL